MIKRNTHSSFKYSNNRCFKRANNTEHIKNACSVFGLSNSFVVDMF